MDDKTGIEQVYELRDRVERLESQRDTLLKELDETEERFETTQRLYKRYFPLIIDLFTEKRTKFSPVLKELGTEFKKGASTSRIENLFQKLHQAILNEEPETAPKKSSPLFSGLFKGSRNNLMNGLKQGYLEIINTLNSTLEPIYLTALDDLSKRILKANDPESMDGVRDDLFDLLQKYIATIGSDREKLTIFVQEIVKRILDMEEIINLSFDHFGTSLEPGEGFDLVLNNEISQVRTNIDVAKNLEGLKAQLAMSFSTIEVALKQKITKESIIKKIAEKNRQSFETGFVKLRKDLVQAIEHSRELERKINQDALTGAFNRRAYNKRVDDEMERFLRYGTIFSLLFIDADHFKNLNDTYGHAIGDKCLQEIIKRTSALIRTNDMLARYGGEEFVLIMPETDGINAKNVAEKIRKTIEKIEFIYKEDAVKVTVSIGVAQAREGDVSAQDVLARADAAVYQAKEGGRNRVVLN